METLRNKIIEALEMKLGEEYKIIPKDKRKNNGLNLRGICIHRDGESVSPTFYVEDYIQHNDMGEPNPEEIADLILKTCHQDKIPQNVADHLKDFGVMKEKVRMRLVNHAANVSELGNIPHRRFLDLAVTYYLDMGLAIAGQHASAAITNELMEIWGITENVLYRLGMEKLLAGDECCITDMFSILRQIAQDEQDKITEKAITELEKDQNGPEMYVASNKKRLFGANCLMNVSLLQELTESLGCSLIIFPSSIHELVIIPHKNGSENCIGPADVQAINVTQVSRDEWLSNSIYRYDREKREVSVYKEGAPLLW